MLHICDEVMQFRGVRDPESTLQHIQAVRRRRIFPAHNQRRYSPLSLCRILLTMSSTACSGLRPWAIKVANSFLSTLPIAVSRRRSDGIALGVGAGADHVPPAGASHHPLF
jgi:hypothetical protein